MRTYKGFIMGLIIGIILASAGTVFADGISTMMGKKVDTIYPVYVNGNRLKVDAIAIEGKSYIPTTDYAATVGYAVYFDAVNKKIELSSEVPNVQRVEQKAENIISNDPNVSTIITGDGTYQVTLDPEKDRDEQNQKATMLILKTNELSKAQAELIHLQESIEGAKQSYLSTGYPEGRWPETAIYKSYMDDISSQQALISKLQSELDALRK